MTLIPIHSQVPRPRETGIGLTVSLSGSQGRQQRGLALGGTDFTNWKSHFASQLASPTAWLEKAGMSFGMNLGQRALLPLIGRTILSSGMAVGGVPAFLLSSALASLTFSAAFTLIQRAKEPASSQSFLQQWAVGFCYSFPSVLLGAQAKTLAGNLQLEPLQALMAAKIGETLEETGLMQHSSLTFAQRATMELAEGLLSTAVAHPVSQGTDRAYHWLTTPGGTRGLFQRATANGAPLPRDERRNPSVDTQRQKKWNQQLQDGKEEARKLILAMSQGKDGAGGDLVSLEAIRQQKAKSPKLWAMIGELERQLEPYKGPSLEKTELLTLKANLLAELEENALAAQAYYTATETLKNFEYGNLAFKLKRLDLEERRAGCIRKAQVWDQAYDAYDEVYTEYRRLHTDLGYNQRYLKFQAPEQTSYYEAKLSQIQKILDDIIIAQDPDLATWHRPERISYTNLRQLAQGGHALAASHLIMSRIRKLPQGGERRGLAYFNLGQLHELNGKHELAAVVYKRAADDFEGANLASRPPLSVIRIRVRAIRAQEAYADALVRQGSPALANEQYRNLQLKLDDSPFQVVNLPQRFVFDTGVRLGQKMWRLRHNPAFKEMQAVLESSLGDMIDAVEDAFKQKDHPKTPSGTKGPHLQLVISKKDSDDQNGNS